MSEMPKIAAIAHSVDAHNSNRNSATNIESSPASTLESLVSTVNDSGAIARGDGNELSQPDCYDVLVLSSPTLNDGRRLNSEPPARH